MANNSKSTVVRPTTTKNAASGVRNSGATKRKENGGKSKV